MEKDSPISGDTILSGGVSTAAPSDSQSPEVTSSVEQPANSPDINHWFESKNIELPVCVVAPWC